MANRVFVIGVGMTEFEKPGRRHSIGLARAAVVTACQRAER